MKNKNIVKPIGLKGNEQINRMKSLMDFRPLNEGINRSVVELTKLGPDGIVYGIIRENHNYFIKIAQNKKRLVAEDFNYIGGLQNKNDVVYESYAKAIKQLNLKFISLNEALGKSNEIDTFKNDNILEQWESYSEKPKPSQPDTTLGTVKSDGKNDGHDTEIIGDAGETGNPDVSTPPVVEEDEAIDEDAEVIDEVELTETEKAIDKMILEARKEDEGKTEKPESKLKITTALKKINEGCESSKKKV
jgi:hypothetical protein